MYTAICGCSYTNKGDKPGIFSAEGLKKLADAIYSGVIDTKKLPVQVYNKIAGCLFSGVEEGYGEKVKPHTPDNPFLLELRTNVYVFSAAKTYQQVRDVSGLLNQNNKLIPYAEFKEQAANILTQYNENYLQTEYNYAVGQARMAARWQEIEAQKAVLPFLQYESVGDARVREVHKALDGVIRRVDDPFWSRWMPLNGWGCRCLVKQLAEGEETDISKIELPVLPKEFAFNAGKQRIIYSPQHPYFTTVPKEDKEFARKNFGLDIP